MIAKGLGRDIELSRHLRGRLPLREQAQQALLLLRQQGDGHEVMLFIPELCDLTRGLAQPIIERAPAPTRRDVVRQVNDQRWAEPQRFEYQNGDVESDRRSARSLQLEIEARYRAIANCSLAVLGVEGLAKRPMRLRQLRERLVQRF